MPFTVITLKSVPASLRGDLTKWMQEIATGVYVGNFNARVRENLWKRVCDARGTGEATMSFMCQNEIGYDFMTINADRQVIDYDGIPLILIPDQTQTDEHAHFSKAYAMHKARMAQSGQAKSKASNKKYVVIDIETTGLDISDDQIIELGAVKYLDDKPIYFHKLIKIDRKIPQNIIKLTGITNDLLNKEGVSLKPALIEFQSFISDYPIVGYNVDFDISFLNENYRQLSLSSLSNKVYDLKKIVKKEQLFQKNYKLQTSLQSYGINEKVPHRALEDAKLIYKLSTKVNKLKISK